MPYNFFDDFKQACKDKPETIIVEPEAETDARLIYDLKTKSELLKFIGNNGLENIEHVNIAPWRNNPDKVNNPLDVYAYRGRTMGKSCYIAIINIEIFFGNTINKWKLKSFHPDKDQDQPMLGQLLKLGFQPSRGNK